MKNNSHPPIITIQCGIEGEITANQLPFWSVLRAVPLSFTWTPQKETKYSFIFTSKIAVKLFAQKFISQTDMSYLENIYTVGASTAELVKKELFPYLTILYPKNEGLYNLLMEYKFSEETCLSIFTALNGKTNETMQKIIQEGFQVNFQIIPTYQLEPISSSFLEQFFHNKNSFHNTPVIFSCGSGQVLKEVVFQLREFFSCQTNNRLPSFIYFTATKQSVKNEIQLLDLVDRIWRACKP